MRGKISRQVQVAPYLIAEMRTFASKPGRVNFRAKTRNRAYTISFLLESKQILVCKKCCLLFKKLIYIFIAVLYSNIWEDQLRQNEKIEMLLLDGSMVNWLPLLFDAQTQISERNVCWRQSLTRELFHDRASDCLKHALNESYFSGLREVFDEDFFLQKEVWRDQIRSKFLFSICGADFLGDASIRTEYVDR